MAGVAGDGESGGWRVESEAGVGTGVGLDVESGEWRVEGVKNV